MGAVLETLSSPLCAFFRMSANRSLPMRLSVVALAGAALLAVSTIASADDNGALTGAAGVP